MELTGKTALITGGKRIGGVAALALAERGADVALVFNRSAAEAESTAAGVRKVGRRAVVLQANLADPVACESVVRDAANAFGRLDILLNMASVYRPVAFADTDSAAWDSALNIDLMMTVSVSRIISSSTSRG